MLSEMVLPTNPLPSGGGCRTSLHHTPWNGTRCTSLHHTPWNGTRPTSSLHHTPWNGTRCTSLHHTPWNGTRCTSSLHHTPWNGTRRTSSHHTPWNGTRTWPLFRLNLPFPKIGAANIIVKGKHHAIVRNERWVGDITFEFSWDIDDLCEDVAAPTCGLTELRLSGNDMGDAGAPLPFSLREILGHSF